MSVACHPDSMGSDSLVAGGGGGGGGGGRSGLQPDSTDSFDLWYKSSRPHRLKLLTLSAELMRSPASKVGKESSVRTVGLLEEARNRRCGRKERCVHWDRVEVKGREFPLQRADTSTSALAAAAAAAATARGRRRSKSDPVDESDPSYLLVGHSTCDMCLVTFESSSVSGIITMKRIMEARREWGLPGSRSKKYAAASNLYQPARLCVLCSQFFRSKMVSGKGEGELVPCGVGRSAERVSLSLESMASNKPLPGRTTTTTPNTIMGAGLVPDNGGSLSVSKQGTRGAGGGDGGGGGGGGGGGSSSGGVIVEPNFLLDELIADDRLVVSETDLARQPGTRATQSSTADGMGPHVCISFPASTDRRARRHRPSFRLQHNAGEGGQGETPEGEGAGVDFSSAVSSVASATSDTRTALPGSSKNEKKKKRPYMKAAAAPATTPALATPNPDTPPRKMRIDEIAAAAAAAVASRTCSRTRRECQPWWEVDLGGAFPVRCIRVHHPDRRTEATKAGASPFVDVAPFWIMTSAGPVGEAAPEEAQEKAIAANRFASHGKVTTWELGANHFATAVRVQAEGVKSLQLARVEVIKGGGTQQAKDAVQQQSLALISRPQQPPPSGPDDSSSTHTLSSVGPVRAKDRPDEEHAMAKKYLLQFFLQGRGETLPAPSGTAVASPIERSTGAASGVAAVVPAAAVAVVGGAGGGDTAKVGPGAMSSKLSQSVPARGLEKHHRPQTSPAFAASSSVGNSGSCGNGGGGRCASSEGQRQRRRRRRKARLPGEDVRHLLLRAMVGYDWVDDLNGQEMRVRGAFTEQDVVVLEDIFFRCALGDDPAARAAATVSDPLLRLDAGELCGDLRRLQLQVQTNAGGKSKTPMLLAVRESPNLFQLLSSGVVETLPDALARAEAQLPPAQRPLCLDWTRFLGVMGLCLEGACGGVGTVAASSVARLFEEAQDERLDFLTRKRSRLPPSSGTPHDCAGRQQQQRSFSPSTGGGGGGAGGGGGSGTRGGRVPGWSQQGPMTTPSTAGGRSDATTGASAGVDAGGSLGTWAPSSADGGSLREGGGGVDTGDDTMELSIAVGGTGTSAGAGTGVGTGVSQKQGQSLTASHSVSGRRRAQGGSSAALKSLLRPQERHEVFRGYGEAVERRRGRQQEAFRRAPEPDVEPTRAYKPCGLCQAPFPVDSLRGTVSLKVLGTFLARAGAPSERFERKASRLCALHRLPLCVFCSQFFDPDFPGGIVPPGGYTARHGVSRSVVNSSGVGTGVSGGAGGDGGGVGNDRYEANDLVSFFDDRFPDRWSDTPPSSSAPMRSPPRQSSAGAERADFPALSTVTDRRGGGGSGCRSSGEGGDGRAGVGRYLREAAELRKVGGLVRGGFSIRDRLLPSPV